MQIPYPRPAGLSDDYFADIPKYFDVNKMINTLLSCKDGQNANLLEADIKGLLLLFFIFHDYFIIYLLLYSKIPIFIPLHHTTPTVQLRQYVPLKRVFCMCGAC
jgi:hypothetical protein